MNNNPDILVIGAGAAGLMAALAARGAVAHDGTSLPVPDDAPTVVVINNEKRQGMKILISGGGRCNVTNERVSETDYLCDKPKLVRSALRGFGADDARRFFESRGVELYAEPMGKLFPKTDKASDIVDCLHNARKVAGIEVYAPVTATSIRPVESDWQVQTNERGEVHAKKVILATGGKSIPGTGSRGFGYQVLKQLGQEINEPRPALTPVKLLSSPFSRLSGLTVPAVLSGVTEDITADQAGSKRLKPAWRAAGSLLFTHDGISGPVGLDISGAIISDQISADFWSLQQRNGPWAEYHSHGKPPGACLSTPPIPPTLEIFKQQAQPLFASAEQSLGRALAANLPHRLIRALLELANIDEKTPARAMDNARWRSLWLAMTQAEMEPAGVAGFEKAEVTTGGLPLSELTRDFQSRKQPGLFVCGEVLDVTGRLGGFNFQWAWTSGYLAGISPASKGE
ncbi:MAG: aminoacetone oxidase family FAD-binding enzyme [Planctomycetes bacterium]|nr:aminoacetone oxidase family FAD-binding enzyme [Planctomycetota bacterium]